MAKPNDPMRSHHKQCVFKLTEMIEADMSTVSRHLKMLKEAGIIKDEKHGTLVYYHLNVPCVKFLDCLDEIVRETLMNMLNQV